MEMLKINRFISSSDSPPDSPTLASMYMQIQNQQTQRTKPPAAAFSNLRPRRLNPSILSRSISDELYTNAGGSSSPAPTPKFRSILSSKQLSTKDLDLSGSPVPPQRKQRRPGMKKRAAGGKNLTSLEVEELKGFMDLGFVFSEEDKDSSLVSILPGLQRMGKTEDMKPPPSPSPAVVKDEGGKRKGVKNNNPLMNWRVPTPGNETELKDSLRLWAHNVASTIK